MATESHSTEKETERRRDNALRRALSTPPKPKQESVKPKERKPKEKSAKRDA